MTPTAYSISVDPGRRLCVVRGPGPRNRGGSSRRTRLPVGEILLWRFQALGPILPVHERILKSLEMPSIARGLPGGIEVQCPKEFFRHRNDGGHCKVFVLAVPCYADLAFRSMDLIVYQGMLNDLRRVLRGEMPLPPKDDQEVEDGERPPASQAHGQGQLAGVG